MNREPLDRLTEALDDEYKARATDRRVIDAFGPVRPFADIVAAEQRHVDALTARCEAYRLSVPEDSWPARVTAAGAGILPGSFDAVGRAYCVRFRRTAVQAGIASSAAIIKPPMLGRFCAGTG